MATTPAADASAAAKTRHAPRERQSNAADLLIVRPEDHHGHWNITVTGELDMATAPLLERELLACEALDTRPISIDLRNLAFIDLHGLRVLLAASHRTRTSQRQLTILPGPHAIQHIIEVTHTKALLPLLNP